MARNFKIVGTVSHTKTLEELLNTPEKLACCDVVELRFDQYMDKQKSLELCQNIRKYKEVLLTIRTNREVRDDSILELVEGEPMIFGKEKDNCIVFDGFEPVVKKVKDVNPEDIAIHKPDGSLTQAQILAQLGGDLPTPMGIIRQVEAPVYDEIVNEQVKYVKTKKGAGDLQDLLKGNSHWDVD